jgi:hypothetical protein
MIYFAFNILACHLGWKGVGSSKTLVPVYPTQCRIPGDNKQFSDMHVSYE